MVVGALSEPQASAWRLMVVGALSGTAGERVPAEEGGEENRHRPRQAMGAIVAGGRRGCQRSRGSARGGWGIWGLGP
jgi:hypothetical protein